MFGTTSGDDKAVKVLEEVIQAVAPEWTLRGFKGDLLDTAVLVRNDKQVEVQLTMHGKSGRARLDDGQERKAIRDQILNSLKHQE